MNKKKYYCIESNCNRVVEKSGRRCLSCGNKDDRSSFYKDGRCKKQYFCIEEGCNNKIHFMTFLYGGKRCRSCAIKLNIKNRGSFRGKNNPSYKDGRTDLRDLIRKLPEYNDWRISIYKRDYYSCVECGNKIFIEAHHYKKTFSDILSEFLSYYNQFSPIEDKETLVRLAITWKDFWDINNGTTVCRKCHKYMERMLKLKGDHHGTKDKKRIKIKVITESVKTNSKENM